MGIPRFYRAFSKKFKNKERVLYNCTLRHPPRIIVDHFYLDANSIVHRACQQVYGYGSYSEPIYAARDCSAKELEILAFRETCNYIDLLATRMVQPQKSIHIMIDGVCPLPKQQQQRKRRFRTALESTGNAKFDSNSITPGTRFMAQLCEYLEFFIRLKVNQGKWKFDVYFSDSNHPGEGEHKIAKWIREHNENYRDIHCIYGLDADLIVISTVLPPKDIFLLREDVFAPLEKMNFHWFSVEEFRLELFNDLRTSSNTREQALKDFVILSFMIGNDFVSCIPLLANLDETLPMIFQAYTEANCVLYDNGKINVNSFTKVCYNLYEKQKMLITRESMKVYKYPDETLQDSTIYSVDNGKWLSKVDFHMWRKEMDKKFVKNSFPFVNSLDDACNQYIYTLNWIATYYFEGVSDYNMPCSFNYSPTLPTIYKHCRDINYSVKTSQPTSVDSLLLSVTPRESIDIVNHENRHLLLGNSGEVNILREGTDIDWFGITKVDPIAWKNVVNIESKLKVKTPISKKRLYRYETEGNFRYKFDNEYGYVNLCKVRVTHMNNE